MNIDDLLLFKEQYGHLRIRIRHGKKLASRVGFIRSKYKKGELSKDDINRLENIGFCWSNWDANFLELTKFKEKYGHCKVPGTYEDQELTNWVLTQRHRKHTLNPEREKALQNIGFCWDVSTSRWEEMCDRLFEYNQVHGNPHVIYNEGNEDLAAWLTNQIKLEQKGKLDSHRKEILENLGVIFKKRQDVKWDEMIQMLKRWKEEHGTLTVPYGENKKLRNWIMDVRKGYAGTGSMDITPERIKQLNALGFTWSKNKKRKK